MGQRKTWSLHHVPFTMLWETLVIEYNNNWNSVINTQISNKFFDAVYDRNYKDSCFSFIWKNKYFTSKFRSINCDETEIKLKKKKIQYTWVINANKGSNETFGTRSYHTSFDTETIFLNFFFRQSINFNVRDSDDIIDRFVKFPRTHILRSNLMLDILKDSLLLKKPLLRFKNKRKLRIKHTSARFKKTSKTLLFIKKKYFKIWKTLCSKINKINSKLNQRSRYTELLLPADSPRISWNSTTIQTASSNYFFKNVFKYI